MVLVPEINPQSFLFFFEKGATGFSYSLRDYSIPNHVTERRARDFGWTADQVRRKATHILDAPYMDVNLLGEWHSYTRALNASLGIGSTDSTIMASTSGDSVAEGDLYSSMPGFISRPSFHTISSCIA